MTPEQKKVLDARSTHYIIGLMRQPYWNWDYDDEDNKILECADNYIENGQLKLVKFTIKELKEYLATRPHVMNKKESRAAIKQRKKSGLSRVSLDKKKKKVYIVEPQLIERKKK